MVGTGRVRPCAPHGAGLPGNDLPRRIPGARRGGRFWPLGARLQRGPGTQRTRAAAGERSRALRPGWQTRPKSSRTLSIEASKEAGFSGSTIFSTLFFWLIHQQVVSFRTNKQSSNNTFISEQINISHQLKEHGYLLCYSLHFKS
jgi:hypothetical protein